jgi:hypothetical protein
MPKLPATAATVEALVPQGWAIEQQHHAHFNRDPKTDVLLLLRQEGADAATPPRMLLVALATATPSGYALAEANARLVPGDPSGAIEDPMADGEITVRRLGFDLKISMTPGVGSYIGATMRYRFRREGGCFRLIRYDRTETHRGTLDTTDLSVDFLNRLVIHKTGNEQSDEVRTRRERLRNNPRRCLADLGNGWTFDPLPPAR